MEYRIFFLKKGSNIVLCHSHVYPHKKERYWVYEVDKLIKRMGIVNYYHYYTNNYYISMVKIEMFSIDYCCI